MSSSKEAARTARKLFKASLSGGALDLPTVQKVVGKLLDAKPRGYMGVLDAYWRLVRLNQEQNLARVESAEALDEATKTQVTADLKSKYGPQIETEFSVNPELIAGIRIRVGSDVWDGSVKNRLERLAEKFN